MAYSQCPMQTASQTAGAGASEASWVRHNSLVFGPLDQKGCAVRMMQALLALAMMGAAGPLICDAGCIARAEDVRPAPKTHPADSGLVPVPVEHEAEQREYERLMRELPHRRAEYGPRQPLEYDHRHVPQYQPAYQTRRGPLRGDFWTRDEIKRYFGRGL